MLAISRGRADIADAPRAGGYGGPNVLAYPLGPPVLNVEMERLGSMTKNQLLGIEAAAANLLATLVLEQTTELVKTITTTDYDARTMAFDLYAASFSIHTVAKRLVLLVESLKE